MGSEGNNSLEDEKRRNLGLGKLEMIPDELLIRVLSFLEIKELIAASRISSVMYILANEDELLWKNLCLQKHHRFNFSFIGTWKWTTLLQHQRLSQSQSLFLSEAQISSTNNEEGKINQKRPSPPSIASNYTISIKGFYSPFLYNKWYRSHAHLQQFGMESGQIPRILKDVSIQEFISAFDIPGNPVICKGWMDDWEAMTEWTKEKFLSEYSQVELKISQKEKHRVRLLMSDYLHYISSQHDENPLYVFDSQFATKMPKMQQQYKIIPYFKEDFLALVGKNRPDYQWIVMGPMRSGSPWHQDPHGSSAWNALISGRKRWALYPPHVLPPGVSLYIDRKGNPKFDSSFPMEWFLQVYPSLPQHMKPLECTQEPGEIIYVPRGWWHTVLNLEDSIAVTENFINMQNLSYACDDLLQSGQVDDLRLLVSKIYESPQYSSNLSVNNILKGVESRIEEFEKETTKQEKKQTGRGIDWEACIKVVHHALNSDAGTHSAFNGTFPFNSGYQKAEASTNKVFYVGDNVIKFYRESSSNSSHHSYIKELTLYQLIAEQQKVSIFPNVVTHGILAISTKEETKSLHDGETIKLLPQQHELMDTDLNAIYVPFIVTKRVQGNPVKQVCAKMKWSDLVEVAQYTAKSLAQFHRMEITSSSASNSTSCLKFKTENFDEFISNQRDKCFANHQKWGTISYKLLNLLPQYLPLEKGESIFKKLNLLNEKNILDSKRMCLLHGDVTDENVLGYFQELNSSSNASSEISENNRNKRQKREVEEIEESSQKIEWKGSGIIDLGDARMGDIMYELVALHISLFRCNKKLLQIFLETYHHNSLVQVPTGSQFAFIAMCYTLLHPCDAMRSVYQWQPDFLQFQDWDSLALSLWSLD